MVALRAQGRPLKAIAAAMGVKGLPAQPRRRSEGREGRNAESSSMTDNEPKPKMSRDELTAKLRANPRFHEVESFGKSFTVAAVQPPKKPPNPVRGFARARAADD